MTGVTSISFLLFFAVLFLVYYGLPGKLRWGVLLAGSLFFYTACAVPYTIVYLLASVLTVYPAARYFAKADEAAREAGGSATEAEKRKKRVLILALAVNFGILATLKYRNLLFQPLQLLGVGEGVSLPALAAPLGISFYTLQITGYLLDCYWGTCKAEKNPGRLLLFTCYFPQMVSGPISRYDALSGTLFAPNRFDTERTARGVQRILWGFFLKLVISERLAVIVNAVYDAPETYTGLYVWAAAFAFILQLYTDFSGCMDIVLGVSECFGVTLPENFRMPFLACTTQEFWQRWHITLGTWLKDYIMYPVLKSDLWYRMGTGIRKRWGKSLSRKIPTWAGLLILWTAMGVWHGNDWKYVIGEGFWFWLLIVGGQICAPLFDKGIALFHINRASWYWKWVQRLRTFVCFAVGMIFFRADSLRQSFAMIRNGLLRWNTAILTGGLWELGLSKKDGAVLVLGLFLLLIVSLLRENGSMRERVARWPLPVRWAVWYLLFFAVLVTGFYGPSCDMSGFIYAQF